MGWIARHVKRLERLAGGGSVVIPQKDGSVKRFPRSELAQAYLVNCRRYGGEDVELHPLTHAADNSSDKWWRESVYATPYVIDADGNLYDPVGHPCEDLSEQAQRGSG